MELPPGVEEIDELPPGVEEVLPDGVEPTQPSLISRAASATVAAIKPAFEYAGKGIQKAGEVLEPLQATTRIPGAALHGAQRALSKPRTTGEVLSEFAEGYKEASKKKEDIGTFVTRNLIDEGFPEKHPVIQLAANMGTDPATYATLGVPAFMRGVAKYAPKLVGKMSSVIEKYNKASRGAGGTILPSQPASSYKYLKPGVSTRLERASAEKLASEKKMLDETVSIIEIENPSLSKSQAVLLAKAKLRMSPKNVVSPKKKPLSPIDVRGPEAEYIGPQEDPLTGEVSQLFNVKKPGHELHGSTIGRSTAKAEGIVLPDAPPDIPPQTPIQPGTESFKPTAFEDTPKDFGEELKATIVAIRKHMVLGEKTTPWQAVLTSRERNVVSMLGGFNDSNPLIQAAKTNAPIEAIVPDLIKYTYAFKTPPSPTDIPGGLPILSSLEDVQAARKQGFIKGKEPVAPVENTSTAIPAQAIENATGKALEKTTTQSSFSGAVEEIEEGVTQGDVATSMESQFKTLRNKAIAVMKSRGNSGDFESLPISKEEKNLLESSGLNKRQFFRIVRDNAENTELPSSVRDAIIEEISSNEMVLQSNPSPGVASRLRAANVVHKLALKQGALAKDLSGGFDVMTLEADKALRLVNPGDTVAVEVWHPFEQSQVAAMQAVRQKFDDLRRLFPEFMPKEAFSWPRKIVSNFLDKLGIKTKIKNSEMAQKIGEKSASADEISKYLTPRMQEFLDYTRKLYDEYFDRILAVQKQLGKPESEWIKKRPDYFLHFRELQDAEMFYDGVKDVSPYNFLTFFKPNDPYFNSLKHRIGNKTEFDAVGGLMRYMSQAERYINVAPTGEAARAASLAMQSYRPRLAKVLNDAVNNTLGQQNLASWLPDSGGIRTAFRWYSKAINRQVTNEVGFNLRTALKQSFSIPLTIARAGPKNTAIGFVEAMTAHVFQTQALKEAYANSPALASHGLSEVRLNKMVNEFTATGKAANLLNEYTVGIMDQLVSEVAYFSGLRAAKDAKLPLDRAIIFADGVVSSVNAKYLASNLPLVLQQKELQALFPLNRYALSAFNSMRHEFGKGEHGKLRLISAILFVAAGNAVLKEISDSTGIHIPLFSWLENIPVFRPRSGEVSAAPFGLAQNMVKAASAIAEGKPRKAVDIAAEQAFMIGMPIGGRQALRFARPTKKQPKQGSTSKISQFLGINPTR